MRTWSEGEIDEIRAKLKNDFSYWYHKIDLGHGIVTPGFDYDPLWDNIRAVRSAVDYAGKTVLDIASFDGMFAFEAEKLGAKTVVATDCLYRTFRNFMFCREVLGSQCLPYYNISPYNLTERLDVFLQENYDDEHSYERTFDIVQHLGLLYHLRDPLLSLSQTRSCLKTGGTLIIESNVIWDSDESYMLYNGIPQNYRVSENYSVWWVPTIRCIKEMLSASLFEPIEDSVRIVEFTLPLEGRRIKLPKADGQEHRVGRLCMLAKAVDPKKADGEFVRELERTFRNPGMDLSHVG